jgi:hypothetical protein
MKTRTPFILLLLVVLAGLPTWSLAGGIGYIKVDSLIPKGSKQEFTNVRLTLYSNGTIMAIHSGGVTSFWVSDLNEEILSALGYTRMKAEQRKASIRHVYRAIESDNRPSFRTIDEVVIFIEIEEVFEPMPRPMQERAEWVRRRFGSPSKGDEAGSVSEWIYESMIESRDRSRSATSLALVFKEESGLIVSRWEPTRTSTVSSSPSASEATRQPTAGGLPFRMNSDGRTWVAASSQQKWELARRLASQSQRGHSAQYFYDGLNAFYAGAEVRSTRLDDITRLLEAARR